MAKQETTGQALSGLKIAEAGSFVSAPFCSRMLGDLGAEVIKIEPPGGEEARRYGPFPEDIPHPEKSGLFLNLNANKMGVTLDFHSAAGKKVLFDLLKKVDVFVVDSCPKVLKSLGIDYESLKEVNPRLIVTMVTPFGQSGPYKDFRGYDITTAAIGGASVGIGYPDRAPLMPPGHLCSYVAGLGAALATMFALFGRQRTGRGQCVDVAQADIIATLVTGIHISSFLYRGVAGIRSGYRASLGLYPNTVLPCKDGYMCVRCAQLQQWIRFIKAIGEPEWSKLPRYRDRRAMTEEYPDEVDALLAPWLMSHTKEEIFSLCRQSHVPFAPVNCMDEVANNPQLKAREYFVEIDHSEAGKLKYLGAPAKFSRTPWAIRRPAPKLGEHNEAIFGEWLGYSRAKLAKLQSARVI